MFFRSHYAKTVLGMSEEFEVLEFHFHHKSEHTIEGVHYDLEMHIVHIGVGTDAEKKKGFASAMGIIFDTTKGAKVDAATEKAIDGFFDSMHLDTADSKK
jgi:carbonic anhydrase